MKPLIFFLYIISIPGLFVFICSIIWSSSRLSWEQQLFVEYDLSKCPPLTTNTKRIWAYWHTGGEGLTTYLNQNIRMWKSLHPDWEVRVIQGSNTESDCHYSKYIPSELMPIYFKDLMVQQQSDVIRLGLIRLHGGVYMDTSITLFEPLEFNFWNHVDKPDNDPTRKSLVGFYVDWYKTIPDINDGFEIWMIVARAQEPLIIGWHDLLLQVLNDKPKPFVKDSKTGEVNPRFEGVNFGKIHDGFLYYGVSTSCLHALLQKNEKMADYYANKSLIINAHQTVYRFNTYCDFKDEKYWDFLVNPKSLNRANLERLIKTNPFMKLFQHGRIFDKNVLEWSNLHNVLGFTRIYVATKAKIWRNYKRWDNNTLADNFF